MYGSAFYINEETENEPNTIYLIYNRDNNPERRTVYRINESGIHIWTRDNLRVRMMGDENTQIDGDRSRYVKGDQQQNIDGNDDTHIKKNRTSQIDKNEDYRIKGNNISQVDGNHDHKTKGNFIIEVQGNTNISVDGDTDVWSGSSINCDAPVINLNCGIASQTSAQTPATPKEKIEVKDLGPNETPEYETGVGDNCDDRTNSYNNEEREEDMYQDR